MLVGDVSSFPGHITCDAESKSEIVVPIVVGGEVGFLFSLFLSFLFLV